jgi:hypothetical protein
MRRDEIRALLEAYREEASRLVKAVALPEMTGDTVKVCIARAAQRLHWTFNRTEDIWRKEARRIDAYEMDQLRRLTVTRASRKNGRRKRGISEKSESVDNRQPQKRS